jgi:hypothetical protein
MRDRLLEVLEEFADVQIAHETDVGAEAMRAARHPLGTRAKRGPPTRSVLLARAKKLERLLVRAAERPVTHPKASPYAMPYPMPITLRSRPKVILHELLNQAGFPVHLRDVVGWPRHDQGAAYLWARAFLGGAENLPPPEFLVREFGWGAGGGIGL